MKPLEGPTSHSARVHTTSATEGLDVDISQSTRLEADTQEHGAADAAGRYGPAPSTAGLGPSQAPADVCPPCGPVAAWPTQRRWLGRLAAAITARMALPDLLRLVRDAVVEACSFDRAGVFLHDARTGLVHRVWGTDHNGNPVDSPVLTLSVPPEDPAPICRVLRGEISYYLTSDHTTRQNLSQDDSMYGVRAHAIVPMDSDGSIVGLICVDNLLSNRPILPEHIEDLLPFAQQAALAVHTAQLRDEVHQVQQTLLRTEKLRAVGELASGVAHNVNNMLAAVQGYTELIQDSAAATAEIRHYARIIERAVQDGANIVGRIQRFARVESETEALPLEIAAIAREAIDLTRPAWHNQAQAHSIKIDVVTDLTPGLQTYGVASEIREVLVNLIKNAVDAMPSGGVVTIRCAPADEDCLLTLSDTGTGMNRETSERIFEPFFTTKSPTHGTGLGLSVAWGIIDRHQGRITVRSQVGQGTTFEIRLPRIQSQSADPMPPDDHCPLSGLRVLLVEDDELVAGGTARILSANGAIPFLAQSADEALEWLELHAATCDLVLSDHGMAGRTGIELLALVREHYPHLRRVLLSGWGQALPDVTDASAAELMLAKPIRQEHLVAALQSVLP